MKSEYLTYPTQVDTLGHSAVAEPQHEPPIVQRNTQQTASGRDSSKTTQQSTAIQHQAAATPRQEGHNTAKSPAEDPTQSTQMQGAEGRPTEILRTNRIGRDSLARHRRSEVATDSLALAPSDTTSCETTDSLGLGVTHSRTAGGIRVDSTLIGLFRTPYRTAETASEVFGEESILVPQKNSLPQRPELFSSPIFQGFVLLLAATYALLIYRHLTEILLLFTRVWQSSVSGERFSEDHGAVSYLRFLHITAAIGMLFIGIIVVKAADIMIPNELLASFSHQTVIGLGLAAAAGCCTIAAYQLGFIRLAGVITISQSFTSQIIQLKRNYFALTVIITSPALLLFALCPYGMGNIWLYIIAVELAITSFIYLKETLSLFLSKKISILHWFLYLCTVEIFPFSLMWFMMERY